MICLVTDRRRLSEGVEGTERLVALVASAARAGVDVIHVRERDLEARALTILVRRCVDAAAGTSAKIVVNDRTDVAIASGAHGVHLRGDSLSAAAIRPLLPPGAWIGRSIHTASEAAAISREGAVDYLVFGTLFDTPSKGPDHPLATLDELAAACRAAGRALPVLAIGGMTVERAALAARAGAAGVAAIGLFIPPAGEDLDAHLQTTVGRLRGAFDTRQPVT